MHSIQKGGGRFPFPTFLIKEKGCVSIMGHSKNKITIRILSIISAISILCLCVYVPDAPAKADVGGFQFLYTLCQYEYLQEIDKTDPLYNPNNIRQTFCNFKRFVNFNDNTDYSNVVSTFADFLNNDNTFQSLDFEQYNVICFNSYDYTTTNVIVYTSSRPLYVTNSNIYSYEKDNSTTFSFKRYLLTYRHDNSSMTNIIFSGSSSPQTYSNGALVNNTYFIGGYDSQFDGNRGNIVYSDCPVRFGYSGSGNGLDYASDQSATSNQLFTANEDGFSNYPVLAIDRRTCCPSWVDTSMSPDDRYINEHSKCGLKRQAYYVFGTPDELNAYYDYELNEYCRINKDHIRFEVSVDYSCGGNYYYMESEIDSKIREYYSIGGGQGGLISSEWNSTANICDGSHVVNQSISNSGLVDKLTINLNNYFNQEAVSGCKVLYNGDSVNCNANYYMRAMGNLTGYSTTSGNSSSFQIPMISCWNATFMTNSTQKLNFFNIIIQIQLVDTQNANKNSMVQRFTYNLVTGQTTDMGDPIIYDDTDIINYPDDPTYEVPTVATTQVDPTQPTTQSVIVDGGSNSIVVTNTNNNTNNPTFNNSPTVNVTVSGGGSDNTTQSDGFVVITDDDEVEYNDVQGVVDDVENFLDFGDTFFDEYIGTLFNTIPQAVWKPFAISSAFIALACMIGYVLRR